MKFNEPRDTRGEQLLFHAEEKIWNQFLWAVARQDFPEVESLDHALEIVGSLKAALRSERQLGERSAKRLFAAKKRIAETENKCVAKS